MVCDMRLLIALVAFGTPQIASGTPRQISWWWDGRPSRKPSPVSLLSFVEKHQDIVSSVTLNCGFAVQANGSLGGNVSVPCVTAFSGLRKLKVKAELWLGEQDSIDAARKLFKQPQLAAVALSSIATKYSLGGINFDLEPHKSNASDAMAYGAFLRAIKPSINAAGARLTVDSALWTPMLKGMSSYADGVDRVLYMHTCTLAFGLERR